MKQKSNSLTKGDRVGKTTKARGPVQRDAKEVMAELVVKLSQKLEPQSTRKSEEDPRKAGMPGPNRDRLTVGVDLGDKWSNFCILGLDGEKLTEGELRTTPQDFAEFFQAMAGARVVMEVGTHSAGRVMWWPGAAMKCWWQTRDRWKGRSSASARTIGSMHTSWLE